MSPPAQPGDGGEEAAQLIARLKAQGELDAHGGFTLDREQARRKIQHFQLANPARYVLELVQAAVLKGAQNLDFAITSAEMHLLCDGEPFTQADFEHLYAALLLRASERPEQARRHLALGLCTALAGEPALVRVESGSRSGGAFIELRKDAPDRLGLLPPDPQRLKSLTTHILVRHRAGAQILGRFFSHRKGKLEQEAILRHHCAYATVRICLDAERLSQGLALPDVELPQAFKQDSLRGLLGPVAMAPARWSEPLLASFVELPTELLLVKNGVWIDTVYPEALLPGYRAVVDCPLLRQDISHEHVVQDEQYQAVVNVVLTHQISRLAADCAQARQAAKPVAEQVHNRLRGQLKTLLQGLRSVAILLRWAGEPPLPGSRITPAPHLPQQVQGAGALLQFPLYRSTQGAWVNLQQLVSDASEHGSLAFSPAPGSEPDPVRPLVLHLADKSEVALLAALLDCPLHDRTSALQNAVRRAHNRAAWQRRPMTPVLPGESYMAKVPLSGPGLRGELGLHFDGPAGSPRRLARLLLVYKGHLLVEKLVMSPITELAIIIESDFTPNDLFNDVVGDSKLCDALSVAFAALVPLAQGILQLPADRHWQPRRARLLRGLLMLIFSSSAQRQLRLVAGSDKDLALSQAPTPVDASRLWSALRDYPLFESLSGDLVSLNQLRALTENYGCVPVLVLPPPQDEQELPPRAGFARLIADPAHDEAAWQAAHDFSPSKARRPKRPPLVLGLTPEEQELAPVLSNLFGDQCVDMHEWLRVLKSRPAAPATPPQGSATASAAPQPLAPPRRMQNECWAWVPLADGASYLGLLSLPSSNRELHRVIVEFYRGPTLIGTRQLPLPTGDLLLASVELSRMKPCSEHELALRLTRSLSDTLPVLVNAVLRGNTLPPDERLWLLRLGTSLFPTVTFRRAYDRLRQQAAPTPAGAQQAEEQYARLLRLSVRYPVRRIEKELRQELSANSDLRLAIARLSAQLAAEPLQAGAELELQFDAPAEPEAMAAALSWLELIYPGSAQVPAGERVRRPLPSLFLAPMLSSIGGALLSLSAVLAEFDKYGEVRYALPEHRLLTPLQPTRKVIEIPDSSSWDSLCCLLGEQSLLPFASPPATVATTATSTPAAPPAGTRGRSAPVKGSPTPELRALPQERPQAAPSDANLPDGLTAAARPQAMQSAPPSSPPTLGRGPRPDEFHPEALRLPELRSDSLEEVSAADALDPVDRGWDVSDANPLWPEALRPHGLPQLPATPDEPPADPPSPAAPAPVELSPTKKLWTSVQADLLRIAPDSLRLHAYLDRVRVAFEPGIPLLAVHCAAEQLTLNLRHPMIQHAIARAPLEPMLRLFVASAVHTAVSRWQGISDTSAADFQRDLVAHAHHVGRGEPSETPEASEASDSADRVGSLLASELRFAYDKP